MRNTDWSNDDNDQQFSKQGDFSTQVHNTGEGGDETAPPRQIFKKLVNKNEIKPKIGRPSPTLAILTESLDPPRDFGKNIRDPLPWIFNPCASMHM